MISFSDMMTKGDGRMRRGTIITPRVFCKKWPMESPMTMTKINLTSSNWISLKGCLTMKPLLLKKMQNQKRSPRKKSLKAMNLRQTNSCKTIAIRKISGKAYLNNYTFSLK